MNLSPHTSLCRGRYIVQRGLASGAMADVYLATDTQRAVYVALKVLRSDLSLDTYFEEYFRREAAVLRQLQHPNIVRLYDLERDGALLILVMDYVAGPTLQQYLFANKLLPTSTALHIARALATALDFAHMRQVIHRDLKLSNVLLANNGAILLSDFGVARVAGSTTTFASRVGTLAYRSPEQITGAHITPAADQYALAIVVWELLTGRRPFIGLTPGLTATTLAERVVQEHLYSPPPAGVLPPKLTAPLMRALEKMPELRFPTCTALVEELCKAPGVQQLTPATWLQQLRTYTKRSGEKTEWDYPVLTPKPKRQIAAWVFGICLMFAIVTGIALNILDNLNRQTASFATATALEATAAADRTEAAMLLATSLAPHTPTPTRTETASQTATATATPTRPPPQQPSATTRPTNPPPPTATPPPKRATATSTPLPPAPLALVDQAIAACGALWESEEKCTNPSLASQLFLQAAATGDMYSMRSLGILACGHKVASENVCDRFSSARPWLEKSAAQGDIWSMLTLGKLYCGSAFHNSPGRCLEPKPASEWLLGAANLGDKNAMYWLAWVYSDYSFAGDACTWWRRAADLGHETSKDPLEWYCL